MRFLPQCFATAVLMGLIYPLYEGIVWNGNFGLQGWLETSFGAPFHDFAGSIVVHAIGGWIALAAVIQLGDRSCRRLRGIGHLSFHRRTYRRRHFRERLLVVPGKAQDR